MYAPMFNQPDGAWAPLDVGADAEADDPGGRTALQLARAVGSTGVADVLEDRQRPT